MVKFLRSRDLDNREAHKVLAAYIRAINERPDIFIWNEEIKVNQAGLYYHYPVKNFNGSKIVVVCPGKWNPAECSIQAIMSQRIFAIETSLMDEDVQRNGIIVIVDMRGLGWTQYNNWGFFNAKLASEISEKISPWKRNSIHVIHENRLTDVGYTLFKPFYGAKLRAKIHFHGNDLEKLYQFAPRSYLPPSLGGTNQEYSADSYDQLLMKHKDTILDMWNRFKVKDERSNKSKILK